VVKMRFSNDDFFAYSNKLFDDFFRNAFYQTNMLRTDVKADEERFYLEIELPGYNKDEIKMTFEKGYLTVEVTKKENQDKTKYLVRERTEKDWRRTFYIGSIDEKQLYAVYHDNGILTVSYPKKKKSEKKTIEID